MLTTVWVIIQGGLIAEFGVSVYGLLCIVLKDHELFILVRSNVAVLGNNFDW